MSFYYEAAQVLDNARSNSGSFKSIVFRKTDWKSDRKALFALTTEASKWSEVLSVVLEKSAVLKVEKQLTPTLALLLAHDLLVSKKGLALSQKHGLHSAILRHKARLAAELTKARVRRGFATLEALRAHVNDQLNGLDNGKPDNTPTESLRPRWIRINPLRTSMSEQIGSTFAGYTRTEKLADVSRCNSDDKLLYIDEHVPYLVAIPAAINVAKISAYKEGKLVLQDKASCFPAYLLDPCSVDGDIIDACAAPGNKTTHLAAIMTSSYNTKERRARQRRLFACERDAARSQTLKTMVNLAGANNAVKVKAGQDFLKLDPSAREFANVAGLLLDPSCSGSGIVGRDEVVEAIRLPDVAKATENAPKGKKRKRPSNELQQSPDPKQMPIDAVAEEVPTMAEFNDSELRARLSALSTFQLRLLEHAMAFPAAKRITYSTCSVHNEENEHVVVKALLSDIAVKRGWRIMSRTEQIEGMRRWHRRGRIEAVAQAMGDADSTPMRSEVEEVSDACIRCDKGSEDGTMGFFLAGFVRDADSEETDSADAVHGEDAVAPNGANGVETMEEEWNGFSDDT